VSIGHPPQTWRAASPALIRLGISLNVDIPLDRQRRIARAIEAAGLDSLWVNDGLGRDPFLVCQVCAEATSTLTVGTGIAQLPTRTPVQQARAAVTLQEASAGRFVLGIGVSQPSALSDWHGLSIDKPFTATRDALEIIRAVTRGQTTAHEGLVYSSRDFKLAIDPLPPPAPIYLGAMRPRSLALAGTHADGVLLSWEGVTAVTHAAEAVRSAASNSGRATPEIAAYVRVAMSLDRGAARRALAEQIAYFWQWYGRHFSAQLSDEAAARARAAYARRGAEGVAGALDDESLFALGWYGTPADDIGAMLESYAAAGLEHLIVRVVPVGDPVDSLDRVIAALG